MSEVDLKLIAAGQTGDFEPEQKRYLEGFFAGVQIAKAAKSVAAAAPGGLLAAAYWVVPGVVLVLIYQIVMYRIFRGRTTLDRGAHY